MDNSLILQQYPYVGVVVNLWVCMMECIIPQIKKVDLHVEIIIPYFFKKKTERVGPIDLCCDFSFTNHTESFIDIVQKKYKNTTLKSHTQENKTKNKDLVI